MADETPILINDLLHLTDEELNGDTYRVRLTFKWGNDEDSDPIARYRRDPDDALAHLLYYRSKSAFKVGQRVIGITKIGGNLWLLTRIVEIIGVTESENGGQSYQSQDVAMYRGLFGRVILRYSNTRGARREVRKPSAIFPNIEVHEVRATGFGDEGFPGYANVTISWTKLKEIVDRRYESWHTALRNMKGVYLIVDTATGAAYVGKADGSERLWTRWSGYVASRHGGNVELAKLDPAHIETHFQWSILEVMDEKTQDDYVNKRESWWKDALSTRGAGGLNRN